MLSLLESATAEASPGDGAELTWKEDWDIGRNLDLQTTSAEVVAAAAVMKAKSFTPFLSELSCNELAPSILKVLRQIYMANFKRVTKEGISSLPDEVLADVFQIAARIMGRKQAVLLSHVSRRFRGVALAERCLWTTLHSDAGREELETFVARSGINTDLHVTIHTSPLGVNLHSFMNTCLHTASRWKSLTVTEAHDLQATNLSAQFILKTLDRSYDLHLPRLHELHIESSRHVVNGEARFRPSWYSPNLRLLSCEDYIPFPSPSFFALSSFTLSLKISPERHGAQIEDLLSFLLSSPSITDVNLRIRGISAIEFVEAIRFEEAECPSITSLSIHFSGLPNGDGGDLFVAEFMNALCVHNVEHLSFSVDYRYADIMDPDLDDEKSAEVLKRLSFALLPAERTRSHLKSLSYDLICELPEVGATKRPLKMLPRTFTVPLDRVPTISTLSVTTFANARIRLRLGDNSCFVQRGRFNLREVRLRGCRCDGVDGFPVAIIHSPCSHTLR